MKTMLVPLEESDAIPSILETAWLAAASFGAYIEGVHIRRALPGIVVADVGGYAAATPDLVQGFEEEESQRAARVRARFEDFMGAKGLILGAAVTEGPSAGWADDIPPGDLAVGMRARLFDLSVVGRPRAGASAPAMSTLETVLFDSGRPVLIAPPSAPASLGETIVVSWNGSTETARALALAMPFLIRARRTIVLAVEGIMVPGPSASEVARYLKRNDVPAETRDVAERGGGGETILREAESLGADLLIKGAYTHSRLRQMILGGATSHILAEARLPVFMAH